MADDSSSATKAVGPYLLQRTLGKGQTGLNIEYRLRLGNYSSFVRTSKIGSSLHHKKNCSSKNYQQRKTQQVCSDEGK